MISDLNYYLHCNPNIAVHVRTFKFPGGEMGVDINTGSMSAFDARAVTQIQLNARLNSSDAVMATLMAADAIRRVYTNAQIDLFIPYFPYARQDRVCNPGEALSAKVMAQLINAFGFRSVWIVDPHSAVSVAALDRCVILDQYDVFKDIKLDWHNWTIVAPDQGALKKTEDFAKRVGAAGVISCTKHRELSTGKITGMHVNGPGDMSKLNLLVLDDICDGGRTFIELAQLLNRLERHKPATIELAVTHGIFSKGLEVLHDAGFTHIYTTDSFQHQTVSEQLTPIKL